jgi:hypothetical protein
MMPTTTKEELLQQLVAFFLKHFLAALDNAQQNSNIAIAAQAATAHRPVPHHLTETED